MTSSMASGTVHSLARKTFRSLRHFDNEFTKDEDDYVPAAVKRDSASWSSSDEESSFSSTDSSEKSVSFVNLAERNNAVDAESS